MTKRPEDAPLGAPPMIPAPAAGAATDKANRLFARYVDELQRGRSPEPAEALSSAGGGRSAGAGSSVGSPVAARPPSSGGRRYPLALVAAHATDDAAVDDAATVGDSSVDLDANVDANVDPTATSLPVRPPPGAPSIRPSVQRGEVPPAADTEELLAASNGELRVISDPDGTTAFEITMDDEVFRGLRCRISVRDERLTAVFFAADVDTRRLLEAEAGRLRVQLEDRGLRVDEVRVVEVDAEKPNALG